MDAILTLVGVFAGIGVFLAAMYSLVQILTLRGRARAVHALNLLLILAVMGALLERALPLARILAVPLLAAAFLTLVIENRWYRIFPVLTLAFTALLLTGHVRM